MGVNLIFASKWENEYPEFFRRIKISELFATSPALPDERKRSSLGARVLASGVYRGDIDDAFKPKNTLTPQNKGC